MKTGKTVKAWKPVWNGGVHGNVFVEETQTLWSVALNMSALVEMDPKDGLRIKRMIPVHGDRPHGLDYDKGSMWVLFAGDKKIEQVDAASGKVLERILFSPEDPDPHGMCLHNGVLYYCDAGLHGEPGPGSAPGYICTVEPV